MSREQKKPQEVTAGAGHESLSALATEFPWFDAAVRTQAASVTELPVHVQLVHALRAITIPEREPVATENTPDDIIDEFIKKGEHRIVPKDDTPDEIEENSGDAMPEDDELTEDLAQVFMQQGLFAQARTIYERLSLLYPKKSVYFAEIIAEIDRKGTGDNSDEQ